MHNFGAFSLLPIFLALLVSILFRRVILGLFLGGLSAALMAAGFSPGNFFPMFFNEMLWDVLSDRGHIFIVLFTLLIGALTGLLIESGATKAFVASLSKIINGRRSAQVFTSLSGFLIFFDDYSNCLIVGSSNRSVCDKHGVSREKLAYLVDSTSAPIASIALVSTWIAFQVSLIADALKKHNLDFDAYTFFLSSIPYNFYAFFSLFLVLAIAISGRDFGPMKLAEQRAFNKKPKPEEINSRTQPTTLRHLFLFYLPVATLVFVTFFVLYLTGKIATSDPAAPLFEIFGNADSYMAMLISASLALFIALFIILTGQLLEPENIFSAMKKGVHELIPAITILLLAWILGEGLEALKVADYLVSTLSSRIDPSLVPTLVFVFSAGISFATGTSFGTMAIMVPVALPLIFMITGDQTLYFATTASILGGAVFGDHCSPLSDTTILSSTGAKCDLLEHVKTQLPYALFTALFSICFGTFLVGFGFSLIYSYFFGIVASLIALKAIGRSPQEMGDNSAITPTNNEKSLVF